MRVKRKQSRRSDLAAGKARQARKARQRVTVQSAALLYDVAFSLPGLKLMGTDPFPAFLALVLSRVVLKK